MPEIYEAIIFFKKCGLKFILLHALRKKMFNTTEVLEIKKSQIRNKKSVSNNFVKLCAFVPLWQKYF